MTILRMFVIDSFLVEGFLIFSSPHWVSDHPPDILFTNDISHYFLILSKMPLSTQFIKIVRCLIPIFSPPSHQTTKLN